MTNQVNELPEFNLAVNRALVRIWERHRVKIDVSGPELEWNPKTYNLRLRYRTNVGATVIADLDVTTVHPILAPETHESQPLKVMTMLDGGKPLRPGAIVEALEGAANFNDSENNNKEQTDGIHNP